MPDIEHTVVVGLVLLAVVPFAVGDAVSSLRAGFDNSFWALPLDEKLDRIVERRQAWRRLGMVWLFIIILMASGLTAFTLQLAEAGEAVWAALGLGAFLIGAGSFLAGALPMITAVEAAAVVRRDTGATPPWLQPAWDAGGWLERTFVIAANLAYVAWGVAIVRSGFPSDWVGWVAVVSGGLIAAWASLSDYWFQHMTLLTPIAVGIALLLY